jgi:hypothetical protein
MISHYLQELENTGSNVFHRNGQLMVCKLNEEMMSEGKADFSK